MDRLFYYASYSDTDAGQSTSTRVPAVPSLDQDSEKFSALWESEVDDILIHSSSEEIHSNYLEQVLHRLQKAGLTLRGNKCQIGLPEVAFLGYVFSGAGVMPDNAKVKPVEEWPKHQTLQKKCSNFWGWPHTTGDLCQCLLTLQHLSTT